jgi:NAD(P)H-flavin reductase
VYENGTLPNFIIEKKIQNLKLSCPKGFGLGLKDLNRGTIIIIAGGTGMYPFSDLIDLLYKDYLIKSGNMLQN